MIDKFLQVLPHLLNGTAPVECLVLFWTFFASCLWGLFRKEKKKPGTSH